MIYCYVDGGYRNDGTGYSNLSGYGSYKILNSTHEITIDHKQFNLPEARSNNEAEYLSLIELLNCLIDHFNEEEFTIYMDSQLVVNQVKGNWKVNYRNLQDLLIKVKSFNLDFELLWIPRNKIVEQLGH